MNIGDMMVNDKVIGHAVVEMESDGKFYTAFKLASGVWLEPFVEETEEGHKAYMKMVVRKDDSSKAGRTSPISPPDTGASSGDEEDSESGEGAST